MYSQYLEEMFVLESCAPDYNRGVCVPRHPGEPVRFLDIGAWHATDKSNTRALFELGWGGILIEPSPGPLRNLAREYAGCDRIQVIGAAVTVHGGLVRLAVTDDALSQPDGARMDEWKETGGFYGHITVPSLSIAELFAQFGGDFEMVSIDTEGTSVDLFAEMLKVGPRPRCVVVEHDDRIVELNQHAEGGNYRQLHLNGTNAVFEWTGRRE